MTGICIDNSDAFTKECSIEDLQQGVLKNNDLITKTMYINVLHQLSHVIHFLVSLLTQRISHRNTTSSVPDIPLLFSNILV